jgi:uncharacterized membrane protein
MGGTNLNPFDIKAALLAKHAQHVVLIHFPIALFIVGVVFDFLAQKTKKPAFAEVAYYNLLGAAICAVPVVATGLLAWQFQLEGQKLKGILLMHLVLGCTSLILIWIAWGLHARSRAQISERVPIFRLGLETVAVIIVGLTGHLGGFLSGINGPS